MKTKILFALVCILLALWAGTVLAQTESQAISLANEAKSILDSAKSKEDYSRSAQKYEEALKIYIIVRSDKGIGLCYNQLGAIQSRLGQHQKSLEYHEKSLAINRKIGDVTGESQNLNNIGVIYKIQGQYKKALEYYEQSMALCKRAGSLIGEGAILDNMGQVYDSQGQYTKALNYFEQSLAIRQKINHISGVGVTLTNLGVVYQELGQYTKALDYYDQALVMSKKSGDVSTEGSSLNNIGVVYGKLGQYTKALDYYERSLEIMKKIGNLNSQCSTLGNIAIIYAAMGWYGEMEQRFKESLQLKQKMGIPVIGIKGGIADLYLDAGEIAKAEPLINETKYSSTLGRLALIKSAYKSAQGHYENDMKAAERTGNTDSLFRSYTGLAKAYEGMKDNPKAEKYYEKAVNQVEEIRSGILPAERKNFFEEKKHGFTRSDPAKGLARVRMKLNRPEESVAPGELTKARAFADHLTQTNATGATNIPPKIIEEEQSLVNSLAAMKTELSKTDREKQPEKYKNLSEAVEEIKTKLSRFVDDLWKSYPAYAAVKYPRPPGLKDSALRPEEYAVIFDVSTEGVGVILIRDKAVSKAFYLDIKLSDLERDIMKFREPFEKFRLKDYDPELAKSLYDKLLSPALVDVPKGAPLTIIPDGILAMLPFEALVTGGKPTWEKVDKEWPDILRDYPAGLIFLGDEHPIGYYQSVTALTLVRTIGNKEKPKDNLLVVADPVFNMKDQRAQQASETRLSQKEKEYNLQRMAAMEDVAGPPFPQLPQTGKLADNLVKMYGTDCVAITGLKAEKLDFLSKIAPRMDQYGRVVFATHGVMGNKVPGVMEPFLALTMVPPGTDGFLKMSDILSLKMNADVVALTACQSGLGKELSGEGVMSMGRAFQYAGAKSVLMSLWQVEEKSAVTLAENFFRYRKEGKTKLESLKSARDDIRNDGYKHPFFWSAFILVGETS